MPRSDNRFVFFFKSSGLIFLLESSSVLLDKVAKVLDRISDLLDKIPVLLETLV
ncbi:hypothetical protein [Filobacillus milosensis]|uniref:hypothetical protein n=1 Tax=Filobacillus milosensis TaxID=94137 RepID=UPI00129BCBB1|nr:hypothetical protein [Filobacillus milosensis]